MGRSGRRSTIMAFTKLSLQAFGGNDDTPATPTHETDIWAVFRALRDTRDLFGLRPGHLHTLQAMLSFLKAGHGHTVFASNEEICRRIGGIDERTLRRHIDRFIELGFMKRNDSPNRKRYRVRSSDGHSISYGLSLSPLLTRASELLSAAQEQENARRDCMFLRKQILSRLACLEQADSASDLVRDLRKTLRRKLTLSDYRTVLELLEGPCSQLSTAVDQQEATKLPANDGQTVRHQSKSEKERKDLEGEIDNETPNLQTLTATCDQATSFATSSIVSWDDAERHARTLAPMIGIHENTFDKAASRIGPRKAACAIFIILQVGNRIRDFAAYFHSITLGRRQNDFNPKRLLESLAHSPAAPA